MRMKRKMHSANVTAKVALDAYKADKTSAESEIVKVVVASMFKF